MNAPFEVGLLTRCQRKVYQRSLKIKRLKMALQVALEIEDIYWEQVRKLTAGKVRTAFRQYAKQRTKDRQEIEKALRSRGVSL